MDKYLECSRFWDNIFNNQEISIPIQKESGNKDFDRGLKWLCENSNTILDFGCGSGTILFLCSNYGSVNHTGIDLSPIAIEKAKLRSEKIDSIFNFICGGIGKLKEIKSNSIDAIILSNIIDNLYPEDAYLLLKESKRILKNNGRVLIKVNPFLTNEEIKEFKIKIIEDNLLDDGLILWNNSTTQWKKIFSEYFFIVDNLDIYYKKYDQTNRMFLCINNIQPEHKQLGV